MRSRLHLVVLLCVLVSTAPIAAARSLFQGYAERGGLPVLTSGMQSTTKVQVSYPAATVTIYLTGTTTVATIYSDSAGTPKANPFTADTNAYYSFYCDTGVVDARFAPAIVSAWTVTLTSGNFATDDINSLDFRRSAEPRIGATNEGIRPALTHFFSTDLDGTSDAAIDVNLVSRYLPVGSATVTAGGSGYTTCTVTFSASPSSDPALGTCTAVAGAASTITVTHGGQYTFLSPPTATIGGPGSGATATAAMTIFARTGMHIKSFTNPDNGADSSGLLVVSTGGGNAITAYHICELRPAGYEDYCATSPQGVLEMGTTGASFVFMAQPGMQAGGYPANTKPSTGYWARIDNGVSRGFLCEPGNGVFDTRDCFTVGSQQTNAAPVNVKFSVKADGSFSGKALTLSSAVSGGANFQISKTGSNPASYIFSAQDDAIYQGTQSADPTIWLYGAAEAGRIESDTQWRFHGRIVFDPYTFATLPAVGNGAMLYCSNCTKGSTPCTGAGTGSFVKGEGGQWNCD